MLVGLGELAGRDPDHARLEDLGRDQPREVLRVVVVLREHVPEVVLRERALDEAGQQRALPQGVLVLPAA